jgi:hypothetical protein
MKQCPLARTTVPVALLALLANRAEAQTDEIQVYDAGIAERGVFNLTWHNNFTIRGARTTDVPGAVVPDRSLNGVPEWAYGVTDWFEAGLYMPLYTVTRDRAFQIDGTKLRLLFVSPHAAERGFFYGVNFEFSLNSRHWNPDRYTSEIRPIVGWHLGQLDLIVNPILDNSYHGVSQLQFVPAMRVAWNVSHEWAFAAEEYSDFGTVSHFVAAANQSHQLWAVVDHRGSTFTFEAGVGFGLTRAADARVLKLIVEHDFNAPAPVTGR